MKTSSKGIELLKEIESLRLVPYSDKSGKYIKVWSRHATIGYGHLICNYEWFAFKDGITEGVADTLFITDLAPFESAVNMATYGQQIDQHKYDALVMLAYNIGRHAFLSSSVCKMLQNPPKPTIYDSIEAAWKSWRKAHGKVNQGLINRRACEWKIFEQGVYQRW